MNLKLQRNHWILIALVLFLGGEIFHYFWSNWGLITVHSKNQPLSQIVRQIEKQGHVIIKTSNLDLTKPTYLWVTNVTIGEAMETLAATSESRWRLTYIVAPDKGAISTALAGITSGQRPEGWKSFFVPLMGFDLGGAQSDIVPDPRKDTWNVKPAAEPTLQAYLTDASKNVSASFMAPESWNPPVKSPPSSGEISKALPKLASAAKSKYEEVFLLQGRGERREADRGERPPREDGGDGPRVGGNFGGRDGFAARDERIQNEINKLPQDQRLAAQQEYANRKQFFEEMRNLTPEQRQQRMEDFMNNPSNQEKMENMQNQRDSRNSPDQRTQRAQNYLQRASAARSAAAGQ